MTKSWIYFWTPSSVPLIDLSIFSPVPHCLNYCGFMVHLAMDNESCNVVIHYLVAILGPLPYQRNLK